MGGNKCGILFLCNGCEDGSRRKELYPTGKRGRVGFKRFLMFSPWRNSFSPGLSPQAEHLENFVIHSLHTRGRNKRVRTGGFIGSHVVPYRTLISHHPSSLEPLVSPNVRKKKAEWCWGSGWWPIVSSNSLYHFPSLRVATCITQICRIPVPTRLVCSEVAVLPRLMVITPLVSVPPLVQTMEMRKEAFQLVAQMVKDLKKLLTIIFNPL